MIGVISHRIGTEESVRRRVALLEDSSEEALAVQNLLQAHALDVYHRSRAEDFCTLLRCDSYDALILDWNLPDSTGYEVLHFLRNSLHLKTPVLMLTARTGESEVADALDSGANDYLQKPWRPLELLARLRALMKRSQASVSNSTDEWIDGWHFDPADCRVHRGTESFQLVRKEFDLARLLFRHLGQPLSRAHINRVVWSGGAETRTIDTHVSRVRIGLKLTAENGYVLKSIYRFGYRLDRLAMK